MHRNLLVIFLVLSACILVVPAVRAQSTPTTIEPGQIEKRFERQMSPRTAPEEIVEPIAEEEMEAGDEVKFQLNGIAITGNEVITEEELRFAYEGHVGTDVSFSTLNKIAAEITKKYRDEGYILARAYIPPQKVTDGRVEIRIVEGFIDKIDIEGDVEGSRALLDSFIYKIRESRPLRSNVLERYMLLMDDLPGVTARGLLRPSEETVGAADLVITIKHELTKVTLEANNRGTKYLGPYQFSTIVRANSWMGNYDRTFVRFVTVNQSEELKFLDVYHSEPIGSEGATAGVSVIRTTSQPGSTLKSSFLDSENVSVELDVSYPIIRSREENLFARAIATYRETITDTAGERLSYDSVRAIRIGAQYDRVDLFDGVNLIDLEVSQGIDLWKSTNNDAGSSRENAEYNFTKVVANISRYQPIAYFSGLGILVTGIGQYASEPLFASEEIGLGGSQFGRAYDPSEISGDHGAAGKVELQYAEYFGYDYLQSGLVYVFYDGGAIWNEDPTSDETGRAVLASAGAGVKVDFLEGLSGGVEVSFPLIRKVASEGAEDEHDPRLFFNVVKDF